MPHDVDDLRPSGIKRKIQRSTILDLNAAGDHPAMYFPHGAHLLGAWLTMTTAMTTADESIDLGIAQNGDTVIDGYTIAYATSAIGDVLDVFQTKGTNGGVVDLAPGTTLWLQVAGTGTAGAGYLTVEYEDQNN